MFCKDAEVVMLYSNVYKYKTTGCYEYFSFYPASGGEGRDEGVSKELKTSPLTSILSP